MNGSKPLEVRRHLEGWELVVAAGAVLAAVAAVWVTLGAGFLAHPGWLAAQKADFILGPVFVGLYWRRRRPRSHFGPLLIACGFLAIPYILQSSSNPWLFCVGLLTEPVIFMVSLTLILTFPTGWLEGRLEKFIWGVGVLTVVVPTIVWMLSSPRLVPAGSIAGCASACPASRFLISPNIPLAMDMVRVSRAGIVLTTLATIAVLVWRLVTGTAPRRRAFIIGAPIALFFLLTQATLKGMLLFGVDDPRLLHIMDWIVVVSRAAIWYGFLFALIAAQLFAGRVLNQIVGASLRRPTLHELQTLLRGPLGDPGLRLGFRLPGKNWEDADGGAFTIPRPASNRMVTEVVRDDRRAVAIVHDAELSEEPELLHAAGAATLLAVENSELDAAWHEALHELRESRARIIQAGDNERQKLERNLHDGVQQRLVSLRIRLDLAGENAAEHVAIRNELDVIGDSVDETIDELRDVAHGLYPPVLSRHGLVAALQGVHRQTVTPLGFDAIGIGRHPAEVESAVYYCCVEAIQNATKHGGPGVQISVTLRADQDQDALRFEVTDDGPGFDSSVAHAGAGQQNMYDRVGALDGQLSIVTGVGHGTVVSGSIPLGRDEHPQPRLGPEPTPADHNSEHVTPT